MSARPTLTSDSPELSDRARAQALVHRIALGDATAEAEISERYRAGLVAMLRSRVGDLGSAEDLCQETLRIAIENLRAGRLRDPTSLASYLWGIAVNLARHERRSSWRRQPLDPETRDPGSGPEECLVARERARLVRFVLDALSPRDRQVLTAFYLKGDEKRAICESHGLSPSQFDVIKFRALRRFEVLWTAQSASDRNGPDRAQIP